MSLLSYSGVTTKVRAMNSKLLKPVDYDKITYITSVAEFVNFLREDNAYTFLFEDVSVPDLHRGDIEKLLNLSIYSDFSRIYRFSNALIRNYLKLYFMKYEVSMIKTCMRMVFDKRNTELHLELFQDFFLKHSKMNLNLMASSTTIEELINYLKGTIYYQPLSKLSAIEHPMMFDYEIQLDLFYFTTLYKGCSKHLVGEDLELISSSYGKQIDLMNILWVYRSKKYLHLDYVTLSKIIIPIHYKLKQYQLKQLMEADSLDSFDQLLNQTYYANKYDTLENYSLEQTFDNLTVQLNRADCRKHPYSVAIVKSYLYQKEKEVKKLTMALECIRYGYGQNEIKQYLQTEV